MGVDLDDVYSLAAHYGRRISKRPDDRFDIIGSRTFLEERGLTAEAAIARLMELGPTHHHQGAKKRPQLMGQGLRPPDGCELGAGAHPACDERVRSVRSVPTQSTFPAVRPRSSRAGRPNFTML